MVTPSYNQQRFLRETIESIVHQGYPNLEYFIVDGGSTDQSREIIRKYADQIDWWVSEPDSGQSEAINKGFQRATGELLAWVNSDDILLPGCLHQIAKCYRERGKPDLIHANCIYVDQEGKIIRAVRVPKQTLFFLQRGVWYATAPAVFFSAEALKQVGYLNPELKLSMDLDIWVRTMLAGAKVVHIPRYMGAFRYHAASKSTIALHSRTSSLQENPETTLIFDGAFKGSNSVRRINWRLIWKAFQTINLNYLRAIRDSRQMQNKHWREVFHSSSIA